jgi:hypothetical protein
MAILLCFVCGLLPALVYVAVTVDQPRQTTYVVAPQPQAYDTFTEKNRFLL